MLSVRLICVGKLGEKFWADAVKEYEKRLGAYCRLEIVELPEARLPLAEAVLLLATAPKSNSVVMSIDAAIADVRAGKAGPIPRELQNVHADGTGFEREQGYKYPHGYPGHWVQQQYLPDELKGKHYYEYGDNKTEQAARAYWQRIKGE